MNLSEFSFDLPPDLIAQRPLAHRDASRLLLASRTTDMLEDHLFRELPDLLRGDELVIFNNARVLPARLFGTRRGLRSQAPGKDPRVQSEYLSTEIEVLLTRNLGNDTWEALVRPGRKISIGERIVFGDGALECEVMARADFGMRRLKFAAPGSQDSDAVTKQIERLGHVPLPPYIRRNDDSADRERYQTVFAKHTGAVAAPTAGLHFSSATLDRLRARRIETCELTLHVGLGTFQPIHTERIEDHPIHSESYEISHETAEKIRNAKSAGRPVLAVGTTVVRALEDAADKSVRRKSTASATSQRLRRRHNLHVPWPQIPHRRSAPHKFSFAGIQLARSRLRICRHSANSPCLQSRRAAPLSLLQLWRLHVDSLIFRATHSSRHP